MASTNKTTNYELSQYLGSDKPTYLGDYNSDMLKIDNAIHQNALNIATADEKATLAGTNANTALTNAGTAQTTADTANTTANSALLKATANETDIANLDKAGEYSSTEDILIGKWIDGRKLYRRVATFNNLANSYYMNKIGDVGFQEIVNIEGYINRKDYPIHQMIPSRSMDGYHFGWKNFSIGGSGDVAQIDVEYGSSITTSTFNSIVIVLYFTKQRE